MTAPLKNQDVTALSSVPRTMLIPLVARAVLGIDPLAKRIVQELKLDLKRIENDRAVVWAIQRRTKNFIRLGKQFFDQQPAGLGVNFGCGLSQYSQWLSNSQNKWFNVDLPESIQYRKKILGNDFNPDLDLPGNILSDECWSGLFKDKGAPVIVFMEGVSMYLSKEDMQKVFALFQKHTPRGSVFVFDHISNSTVSFFNFFVGSVRSLGARFTWGAQRLSGLTEAFPELNIASSKRVFWGYRITVLKNGN